MIEEIRKQHPEEAPEQHLKRLKFRTKHLRKRRLWPRILIAVLILLAVFSWKAYGQVNKVDIQRQNGVQVDATGLPVKVLSCTGCSGTTPFIDSAGIHHCGFDVEQYRRDIQRFSSGADYGTSGRSKTHGEPRNTFQHPQRGGYGDGDGIKPISGDRREWEFSDKRKHQ